jgi:hypothetical protein
MTATLLASVPGCAPAFEPEQFGDEPRILPFVLGQKAYKSYRERLWRRDPHCSYCGRRIKAGEATLDHIKPRDQGGLDTPSNLKLCCEPCNKVKNNRSLQEWIADISEAMEGTVHE